MTQDRTRASYDAVAAAFAVERFRAKSAQAMRIVDDVVNVIKGSIELWPTLVEICIGLEINGYLPAEF